MVSSPQRRADVMLTPVDDGFLATRSGSDVVTWLNRTSTMILELCTGANEPAAIAQAVKTAFDLSWNPEPAVRAAIGELTAAGLVEAHDAINTRAFNLFIAIWAPGETVHIDVLTGIESIQDTARSLGISTHILTDSGRSLRSARNRAAAIALANAEVTHVLFLDNSKEAIRTCLDAALLRLMESGHGVIGIPVQIGETRWGLIKALAESGGDIKFEDYEALSHGFCVTFGGLSGSKRIVDGFIEAQAVGSQALLVSRSALERIAGSDSCTRMRGIVNLGHIEIVPRWGFFDPLISTDDLDIDEETSFCERWRSVGGRVMVDTTGAFGRSLEAAQVIMRAKKK